VPDTGVHSSGEQRAGDAEQVVQLLNRATALENSPFKRALRSVEAAVGRVTYGKSTASAPSAYERDDRQDVVVALAQLPRTSAVQAALESYYSSSSAATQQQGLEEQIQQAEVRTQWLLCSPSPNSPNSPTLSPNRSACFL